MPVTKAELKEVIVNADSAKGDTVTVSKSVLKKMIRSIRALPISADEFYIPPRTTLYPSFCPNKPDLAAGVFTRYSFDVLHVSKKSAQQAHDKKYGKRE